VNARVRDDGPGPVDVAVVGAGVIGLSAAWRLAQAGATVVVVDPAPGSGASGVAAGMLAPVTEARLGEEPLLALNRASWARWPAFAAEVEAASGQPVGYRSDGTLMVALDADDRAVLADLAARHEAMGLAVEPLRGREARALEPGLAPGVRAGLLAADERSVDPQALVAALGVAARADGVTVVAAMVTRVHTAPDDDRVTGLALAPAGRAGTGRATPPGPVPADHAPPGSPSPDLVAPAGPVDLVAGTVVLAAGCWSATVPGVPERARPAVRPVTGEILTLRQPAGDPLVGRTLRGVVRGSSVYLVPRDDGRLVVGATVEERGWDATPTAGGAYGLLRDARAIVPGLDDAELVAVQAGLRPGSPDDLPIIGPTDVDGLIVATGHHRNGVLLTPVTAEAVAAAVAGGVAPAEAAPCDPRRFAAAGVRA
jgi:glycine oxidase